MYCKKCGGKLESYASNCAFCGAPVEKYDTSVNYVKEERANDREPMTAARWIGFMLIPAIPLVGWIIYLVLIFKWASKDNSDLTLRGYARANLIVMLIGFILVIGLVVLMLLLPGLLEAFLPPME